MVTVLAILALAGPFAGAVAQQDGPWLQSAKLEDHQKGWHDQFGATVALDGDTMVVGHPLDNHKGDLPVGTEVGAVTVFEREDGEWVRQETFYGPQPKARFGSAIALEGDTFVTNAPGQVDTNSSAGWCPYSTAKLYVYERTDAGWSQSTILQAPGHEPHNSCIGSEVLEALSIEIDTIAAGVPWSHGEAHIWERDSDGWAHAATFSGPNQTTWHWFGRSVDVGRNGSLVAVGHPAEDVNYLYGRTQAGWILEDSVPHIPGFGGGHGVDLEGDGKVLADRSTKFTENQPVFIHEKVRDEWTSSPLWPRDAADSNPFISDVDLSEQGTVLAVGAWLDDATPGLAPVRDSVPVGLQCGTLGTAPEKALSPCANGAAYLFQHNDPGTWEQTAKLMPVDEAGVNLFGWDVALDDHTLAVGAPEDLAGTGANCCPGSSTGAAYVFEQGIDAVLPSSPGGLQPNVGDIGPRLG